MPDQTDRRGRFSDPGRGTGLLTGLQSATSLPDVFTGKDIKRNLKPFKKFGAPQKLRAYGHKTDTQLENIAANAIVRRGLKRGTIKRRKLDTKLNRKKYGTKRLQWAKRLMAQDHPRAQALKKSRAVRQHIRRVRRNREAMKTPLFSKNV